MMMDPQTVLQVLENQENQPEEQWEPMYSVGEEVVVQSRTWPGINKPGGPARITAVLEGGGCNCAREAALVGRCTLVMFV